MNNSVVLKIYPFQFVGLIFQRQEEDLSKSFKKQILNTKPPEANTYWGIGVGPLAGLGEHRLGKIWMEILTEVCLE